MQRALKNFAHLMDTLKIKYQMFPMKINKKSFKDFQTSTSTHRNLRYYFASTSQNQIHPQQN